VYGVTPLRYPGGKSRLSDFVLRLIHRNRLEDCHYVEPYAGGAGVALSLLFMEAVSEIHLNDLNRSVYAFWHSAINHTDELVRRVRDTRVTVREWERQKEVQSRAGRAALLDLGFSTFFLNRTNRSGILDGGVIGGKGQTGKWKIDARFNKDDLVERIRRVGRYRSRIHLYRRDASELLTRLVPDLPVRSFLYLDPPYFVRGQDLYDNHYAAADHVRIADQVRNEIGLPWMVSYDNAPEIRKLYRGLRVRKYHLPYSAGDRYKGTELLYFAPGLTIPSRPMWVKRRD
jgi:DNA adenine methylase